MTCGVHAIGETKQENCAFIRVMRELTLQFFVGPSRQTIGW
jgi:hypothetical protein